MTRNVVPARQIVTILMLVATVVAIGVLKGRCGSAVEGMFRALDSVPLTDGGAGRG